MFTFWQESFAKAGIEGIASNRFPNWAAVKTLADQGCLLCQIVYQSRHHDSDVSDSKDPIPIRINIAKATGRLLMFVSCDSMGMLNVLPVISDKSDERRFNDYKARCKDITNRANSKGLQKIADMASNWLEECRQGHMCCKVSRNAEQEKVLPTRLIDVRLDNQHLKLIVPDYTLLNLEYLILSYAWCPTADFAKTNIIESASHEPLVALGRST